jgi:hypothetical protein
VLVCVEKLVRLIFTSIRALSAELGTVLIGRLARSTEFRLPLEIFRSCQKESKLPASPLAMPMIHIKHLDRVFASITCCWFLGGLRIAAVASFLALLKCFVSLLT